MRTEEKRVEGDDKHGKQYKKTMREESRQGANAIRGVWRLEEARHRGTKRTQRKLEDKRRNKRE